MDITKEEFERAHAACKAMISVSGQFVESHLERAIAGFAVCVGAALAAEMDPWALLIHLTQIAYDSGVVQAQHRGTLH